jgi:4,5-DOPA dioxygenase extradiol
MNLKDLHQMTSSLPKGNRMPALFVGHGSPMNAIEENEFSRYWRQLGATLPLPTAVLCISAHWLTKGTAITAMNHPRTIHDFGGFPPALFAVDYPAPGLPSLALSTKEFIKTTPIQLNLDWGLDHGTWSVVKQMYPKANIPVLQLSIDYHQAPSFHYELGKELSALRDKGVLIIGSGNMVHNLGLIDFERINQSNYGFDWALEMNDLFKNAIHTKNHEALINYKQLSKSAILAVPTPDHYYPLLYILGMQGDKEAPLIFNDTAVAGSLTMTSVQFG